MNYLSWKEEKISDFSPESVSAMYDRGFVFTRKGKGVMQQTRSIRVNLEKFEMTSENRRILKKGNEVSLDEKLIPFSNYSWDIGKIAKDFYDMKAEPGTFTANKIKELLTTDANFNRLFIFSSNKEDLGYAICAEASDILHYSYPFYDLVKAPKDMGLVMMTKAIEWAKNKGKKYFYIGSLQRPSDTYKLQFEEVEWFDGKEWKTDVEEVKKILASAKIAE